ncbi:MAG: radical SAM protein [Vulcanimicrobiaceae bacterium]
MSSIASAIGEGLVGGRLWLYSNYHCNLACAYCLTESSPSAARRVLDRALIGKIAAGAVAEGFTSFGVTGGEPFMRPDMVDILLELQTHLPVLVLSNATLFTGRVFEDVRRLAGTRVAIQVSLDSASPQENDEMRAPDNFAKVVEAIPKLVAAGIAVRIATTGGNRTAEEDAALCALHRSFGISDDDHVVRPIVHRGRAATNELGVVASAHDLPAELTLTVDGAFWSPFGPTVRAGELDTDMLLARTIYPLDVAIAAMLEVAGTKPAGGDSLLNIR